MNRRRAHRIRADSARRIETAQKSVKRKLRPRQHPDRIRRRATQAAAKVYTLRRSAAGGTESTRLRIGTGRYSRASPRRNLTAAETAHGPGNTTQFLGRGEQLSWN